MNPSPLTRWLILFGLFAGMLAHSGSRANAQDEFLFQPLKMPFPAGPGEVLSGYNNGDRHGKGGNLYSLDLCAGEGCSPATVGDPVVAPTDLELIYSGSFNQVDGDSNDYHIFQVAAAGDRGLCMALGHFALTAEPGADGDPDTFRRGDPMGELLDYVFTDKSGAKGSIPHIHIGLWSVAIADGCAVSDPSNVKRIPMPFDGPFALDGLTFPISGDQLGPVTSTNSAPAGSGPDRDQGESKPIGDNPRERWRVPVEGQYAFSPDERDGVLYVGTYDRDGGGSALLLDADDGTQPHKLSATGQQWSSVEPGPNGTLLLLEGNFAGSGEAFVLALDAETGAERWRIEPDLDQIGGAVAWNDLLILSGGTFRGDQDQATAIAIDIATGEERWRFTPGLDDLYTPVIADDALYFGSFNSDGGAALIALDASSGDELWRFAPAGMWDVATPAIAGDLAVFGAFSYDIDNGGLLIAVELETGTADWQVDSGLDAVYTPAVAGDMVYAGTFSSSGNAALLAIDAATGVEQWRFVPDGNHGGLFSGDPGQDYVGSPAIADNILYVGVGTWDADGDGSLYALEHDGSVRWEFTPNPAVDLVYSPTLADGIAYAGTSDENGAALIAISGS